MTYAFKNPFVSNKYTIIDHRDFRSPNLLKPNTPDGVIKHGLKRSLDLFVSLFALIILSPFLLLTAMLIKAQDGGDAIFRQRRVGRDGREFYCLKFRTMVMGADKKLQNYLDKNPQAAAEWQRDQKLKNDPRITLLGQFLRKTSLDELPQLWNIIKGEMSLVGPRPIVWEEYQKYGDYFPYYTSVLPGVTGLWQVSGRNNTTYDERVLMDVEYANSHSVWGDVKILLQTVPAVLFSVGAY